MGQPTSALQVLLLLLTLSQVHGRPYAAEKSLCSPVEVTLAGTTKFAPGYLLAVDDSTLSQKLAEGGIGAFPESSICTATGYPIGERKSAVGEPLLRKYSLSQLGESAAGSDVVCVLESEEVSDCVGG